MLVRYGRILVVDDHATMRKIIRAMLADMGFENIDEAKDGSDAIAKMERINYALVISDWDMAPMDGLAFLKYIRRVPSWSRIPFIMVTAMTSVKFSGIARDAGATHFLPKPFTGPILAERIRASTSVAA